ncbi:uncharacterized protein N7477_002399 [Penicillium maclennaniae]|uniref:uncharacterized protein n=1 Tax=Penicillium maclennaniae TaxID=1343394 RepID=UPI0025409DCF|nr:uncharacterized protein N7477_002399 [Penicillium maclennaniae]KAJ5676766.1 hypothetical protein N7477_002399 [Penicillium maclennaniae]
MDLQPVSDLQSRNPYAYNLFEIKPEAPFFAIQGDMSLVRDDGFFTFSEAQLAKFQIVSLSLSNLEPWHSTGGKTKESMRQPSDSVEQRFSTGDLVTLVFLN